MIDMKRVKRGVIRYLEHAAGYNIIEDDHDGYIIVMDEQHDTVVVVSYGAEEDMDKDYINIMSRKEFEDVIFKFFKKHHEYVDCKIQYDVCDLIIVHEDRVIVRHYSNYDFEKHEEE